MKRLTGVGLEQHGSDESSIVDVTADVSNDGGVTGEVSSALSSADEYMLISIDSRVIPWNA